MLPCLERGGNGRARRMLVEDSLNLNNIARKAIYGTGDVIKDVTSMDSSILVAVLRQRQAADGHCQTKTVWRSNGVGIGILFPLSTQNALNTYIHILRKMFVWSDRRDCRSADTSLFKRTLYRRMARIAQRNNSYFGPSSNCNVRGQVDHGQVGCSCDGR